MKSVKQSALILSLLMSFGIGNAQADLSNQSEELGKVHWYRNYDKAVAAAKEANKDVLLLFQEVPGCATCRNYGHNVLSHPLMVEAIETSFIPLAIFNNKGGHDAEILKKYKEPSWNNPVVRIINTSGRNVVSRISGDYSAVTLLKRMGESLTSRGRDIPQYMTLLEQELSAKATGSLKEKHFQMYCFWTGEKQLGKVDGVLNVESGFMNYGEVVKVTYDSKKVKEEDLEVYAKKNSFRPVASNDSYRTANSDVHYYLKHTDYKYLPLTPLQQTKINSAIGQGKNPQAMLSPLQRKWLIQIKKKSITPKVLLTSDFEKAWASLQKKSSTVAVSGGN